MGSEKHKSSKDKKHKKEKKQKKRRRDDTESSDSGDDSMDERKKQKSEKMALKVTAHLQRAAATAGEGPKFVWTKKVEKELVGGKKVKELSAFCDKDRHVERLDEIEKVRKRQADRETEKVRRDEELEMVARMRAAQDAMESEAKEEEFYLKALVMKAERRLVENRPEPIDLIAKNLHLASQFDMDLRDPWSHFAGLMLDDAEALHSGVCEYQEYDKYNPKHVEFWAALRSVADHELVEAQRRDASDRAHMRGEALPPAFVERGLHASVEIQVEGMLAGQSHAQLSSMEVEVEASLESGEGDPEYWDCVLRRLRLHKGKSKVRETQAAIMEVHLGSILAAGVDASVRDAMGWDEEDRGVVTAAAVDQLLPPPPSQSATAAAAAAGKKILYPTAAGTSSAADGNDEEIMLDYDDDDQEAAATDEASASAAAATAAMPPPAPRPQQMGPRVQGAPSLAPVDGEDDAESEDDEEEEDVIIADGRFSPPPMDIALLAGQEVVNEEDDYRALELLRAQIRLQESNQLKSAAARAGTGTGNASRGGDSRGWGAAERAYDALISGDRSAASRHAVVHPMMRNIADGLAQDEPGSAEAVAAFRASSSRMMGTDAAERDFGGEVALESRAYWWHEKHKPRKPKYFNRVHTGYEWNKYNQTHYDSDNPPPKTVQGYKFNILYHDLIDKSVPPTYVMEADPSCVDGSTVLLRFTAGAPYEDIAFRVVNKEVEYAHKRGYKCTFDRGILHLYFNFERTRYRR